MTSIVIKALLFNAAMLNALRLIKKRQDPIQTDDSHKIVYGIETYDAPSAVKQVHAQFKTWGKDVPRKHIVIVGGPLDSGPVFTCPEDVYGLICKEATVLYRGMQRLREVDGDWFIGLHEDSYVDTKSIAKALGKQDPSKQIVYSEFGCGVAWEYSPDNKNHTRNPPPGWVDFDKEIHQCDAVAQHGAMCSSAAFVVSRAALEHMTQGMTLNEFIEAHASHCPEKYEKKCQTDTTTSCLLYSLGIKMSIFPDDFRQETIDKEGPHYPESNIFHLAKFEQKEEIPEAMKKLHEQLGH